MAQPGQRKCLSCKLFFVPDCRNTDRQRYCSVSKCQHASKAASQAAWLAKPENIEYFRDPAHVARAQVWRAAHPQHGHSRHRASPALQDPLIAQVLDLTEESANRTETPAPAAARALQDPSTVLSPVLAGLIAHLFGVALQEDMASTTRRLVQLGQDVINGRCRVDNQTSVEPGAAAPGARAVQLG